MAQFEKGQRVRINEGELEGIEGFVVESNEHVTLVQMSLMTGSGIFPVFTEMLMDGKEPHEALAHLQKLYPDFLKAPKSENYRFRLTTYLNGIFYISYPMKAEVLKETLAKAPAGLSAVEFMLSKDDPSRGLAWKRIWAD